MMNSGIYMIFNIVNANFYIGSAEKFLRRFGAHKSQLNRNIHGNKKLQNSWNKHGEQAFRFYKIESCERNKLIEREQLFINELKPEYNICKIAGNCSGRKLSNETRQKISEAHKGRRHSNETRQKISEANKGKTYSNETLKKMCEAQKRNAKNPEWLEKNRVSKIGRRHSEESRIKMSISKKGKALSEGHYANVRKANIKKSKNIEWRQKNSEAQRIRWKDKELRLKQSEKHTGKKHSVESIQKMSEIKRKWWAEKKAAQQIAIDD